MSGLFAAAAEAVPRGSETVLLVEPEPETRKLAAFMLAKRGYCVLEARDAAEALKLDEESPSAIDLLFTETRMAKITGRQLADTLAARHPGLRVLYLCDTRGEHAALRDSGGRRTMLLRPFTMGILATKVRQVLDAPQVQVMRAGG